MTDISTVDQVCVCVCIFVVVCVSVRLADYKGVPQLP